MWGWQCAGKTCYTTPSPHLQARPHPYTSLFSSKYSSQSYSTRLRAPRRGFTGGARFPWGSTSHSPHKPHASPSASSAVPQLDVTQQLDENLSERAFGRGERRERETICRADTMFAAEEDGEVAEAFAHPPQITAPQVRAWSALPLC